MTHAPEPCAAKPIELWIICLIVAVMASLTLIYKPDSTALFLSGISFGGLLGYNLRAHFGKDKGD